MKRLILIRHAKSDWGDPSLIDIERPLNRRGKRDAPEMGRRMAGRNFLPDAVLSSPAKRAKKTAKKIAGELGFPEARVIIKEALYEAGVPEWLVFIRQLDPQWSCVLLIGHNPALTALVNWLGPCRLDNLPTCGVADFTYDTDTWKDVGKLKPATVEIDYPKKRLSEKT